MTVTALAVYQSGPVAVTGDNLNTFVQTAQTANQLRTITGLTGMAMMLQGIAAANDGLGGEFYWDGAATATDDNLNVLVPNGTVPGAWVRLGQAGLSPAVTAAIAEEAAVREAADQLLAPLDSPTFTGTPSAPTAALGTSTTQLATAAFSAAATAVETARAEAAEALLLPKAGVTNGSNAPAGQIGEYISSTVLVGNAVALTTNVAANVTSISLTAGDWDVWGSVGFNPGGSTTYGALDGWINIVSATGPTFPNGGAAFGIQAPLTTGAAQLFPIGLMRISISATTTVYLGALATFGTASLAAFGFIGARRVR